MVNTFRVFIPIKLSSISETINPIVKPRIGKPAHSPYLENLIKRYTKDLFSDLRLGSEVILFNLDRKHYLGFAIVSDSKFMDSSMQGLLNTIFTDFKDKGYLAKIDGGYGIYVEDLKKKRQFIWDKILRELDPIYGGKR